MGILRRLRDCVRSETNRRQVGHPKAEAVSEAQYQVSVDTVRRILRGSERDAALVDPQLLARLDPNSRSIASLHIRAMLLVAWRRFREANAAYRALIHLTPSSDPQLLVEAGWAAQLADSTDEAISRFDQAVAADPDLLEAEFGRAVLHVARTDHSKARDGLLRVLDRNQVYPDAWLNLSEAELGLGNIECALIAAQRAVDQAPGNAPSWLRLARLLELTGDADKSFQAYRQARVCELESGIDAGTVALEATAYYESARYQEAIAICETVLPAEPDAVANAAYAQALLTVGRYVEGWRQYEFRWYTEPMRSSRVNYGKPQWTGQSLQGKTVLLRAEQGIGDVVQFARYARVLNAQGAHVVMHVNSQMARLASAFHGVDEIVERLEPPFQFDYHISMMSLPLATATTLTSLPPAKPYLSVLPTWSARWSFKSAAQRPQVGVVWSGNPRHARDSQRSIPLKALAALWNVEGVRFVSLQKDLRSADAEYLPPEQVLQRVGPQLDDLSDAAAVIGQLDLVVTVDTALAHIAGAMGKPVWLLIPSHADFRWLVGREDSPWYPSMRLFRQSERGNWNEVVGRVAMMLAKLGAGDRSVLEAPMPAPVPPDNPAVGISRVVDTGVGIMQYLPDHNDEARSIARLGEYLTGELELVGRFIAPDAWVVEVGSGFGNHALWLARTLGEAGQVFLYESDAIVQRVLRQNLMANALAAAVTLPRGTLAGSSTAIAAAVRPLHTLDDLALARLDLLKICTGDVEKILKGCSSTLWRLRPILLVRRTHESPEDSLRSAMSEAGYRVWRIRTPFYRSNNYYAVPDDPFRVAFVESLLGIPEEADAGMRLAGADISIEQLG